MICMHISQYFFLSNILIKLPNVYSEKVESRSKLNNPVKQFGKTKFLSNIYFHTKIIFITNEQMGVIKMIVHGYQE